MDCTGEQTISCAQCGSLQDVPLGVGFYDLLGTRAGAESEQAIMKRVASITLLCKEEPWHTVRPWADSEDRPWNAPDAIIAACPRCGGQMRSDGTVIIFN
jgi:hypothetical protein